MQLREFDVRVDDIDGKEREFTVEVDYYFPNDWEIVEVRLGFDGVKAYVLGILDDELYEKIWDEVDEQIKAGDQDAIERQIEQALEDEHDRRAI